MSPLSISITNHVQNVDHLMPVQGIQMAIFTATSVGITKAETLILPDNTP
jgi:hypothetical protein